MNVRSRIHHPEVAEVRQGRWHSPRRQDIQTIGSLLMGDLPDAVNWEPVILTANEHLLTPAIYAALKRAGNLQKVPREIAFLMEQIWERTIERNSGMRKQLIDVVAQFNRAGITPLLTKGARELWIVGAQCTRLMSDLDILVAEDDLPKSETCMRELGFAKLDGVGWGRAFDFGVVDIHYPPGRVPGYWPSDAIFHEHVSEAVVEGCVARICSPTLQLSHSIVHDMIKNGAWWHCHLSLRSLAEVHQIIRSGEVDFPVLERVLNDERGRAALQSQLLAARDLFGTALPPAVPDSTLAKLHHNARMLRVRARHIRFPQQVIAELSWGLRKIQLQRLAGAPFRLILARARRRLKL